LPRRMMDQGTLPEEANCANCTVGYPNMQQQYKETLGEIKREKTLRKLMWLSETLKFQSSEARLRRKRQKLDALWHQGTRLHYSAAFAGPDQVKDAILTTVEGKRLGPNVAETAAQMVPAPDRQDSWYRQLEKAYLDHLLAHEQAAPVQDDPYRVFLEGKQTRLRAATAEQPKRNDQTAALSWWKRVLNKTKWGE